MSYTPAGEGTEQTGTATLEVTCEDSLDSVFTVLSNERRRYVLDCLAEHEATIELDELADEVAVREFDSSLAEISAAQVEQISISLYHVHVPRMEDAGLVEYDRDDDQVALSEDGREVIEAHSL